MPKPKIDRLQLSKALRSGKPQKQVAQEFGVSEGAISKAKKELHISVVKNVALESAHMAVDQRPVAVGFPSPWSSMPPKNRRPHISL